MPARYIKAGIQSLTKLTSLQPAEGTLTPKAATTNQNRISTIKPIRV
jgi:hypothetical protein